MLKDKQIASYAIIGIIVYLIAYMSGGVNNDGMVVFFYWGGLIAFYTFVIWGWVRLFKSDR